MLSMLQVQLEKTEEDFRLQKEQLEKLDQQIQSLKGQRQDVKERTSHAQAQLAELNSKAIKEKVSSAFPFTRLTMQIHTRRTSKT